MSPYKSLTKIGLLLLISGLINYVAGLLLTNNWLFAAIQLPLYTLIAFRLAQSLGSCPLKWRRMSGYTLLILLAHSYWILFLLAYFHANPYNFNWLAYVLATAGMTAGIRFRLRYTYKRCDCQIASAAINQAFHDQLSPHTDFGHIQALITHHPALPAIIGRAFGWKPLFIGEKDKWEMNLICTGKSLVSLPHFSYGALWLKKQNANFSEVSDHLRRMHFQAGFQGLEYRKIKSGQADQKDYKISSWLSLQTTPDKQLKAYSANLRSKIQRGLRNNFDLEVGKEDLLLDFYKCYARHMRHLGSGAISKKFFSELLKHYNTEGGYARIYLLRHNKRTVGAAISLAYKGFYENGWFVTPPAWQKKYASYVLHHQMICDAISLGCHTYSFG
ncbi:MAG: GNAT family N-acetyltransferase, partial [Bacteroidales bacterium]|nr:GNAT family N-acetyltransferase [Bacteroidales bacterium]